MDVEIVGAEPENLNAVLALLAGASLPLEGVADYFPHFLVAHAAGRVLGSVGVEPYGSTALLRSLVVAPASQGRGLGRALVERLLHGARERGVNRVFLLTDTAPGFFQKFGFRTIPREEADRAVQQSVEFRTACGPSTICMRLDL